jgi:hypothetical protein
VVIDGGVKSFAFTCKLFMPNEIITPSSMIIRIDLPIKNLM